MRTVAKVSTEQLRIGGVDVRRLTVDCRHGTTTGDVIGDDQSRVDVLAVLVARHEAEERCGCALPLIQAGARA